MLIVGLVEKDILAIINTFSVVIEYTLLVDPVLHGQFFPELLPHLISTLSALKRDYFFRHFIIIISCKF